jgi:hypothetical protein
MVLEAAFDGHNTFQSPFSAHFEWSLEFRKLVQPIFITTPTL